MVRASGFSWGSGQTLKITHGLLSACFPWQGLDGVESGVMGLSCLQCSYELIAFSEEWHSGPPVGHPLCFSFRKFYSRGQPTLWKPYTGCPTTTR